MKQVRIVCALFFFLFLTTRSEVTLASELVFETLVGAVSNDESYYLAERQAEGMDLCQIYVPTHDYLSLLHLAAERGSLGCIYALLTWGMPIDDQQNNNRLTALHIAAMNGRAHTVKVLLDWGASKDKLCTRNGKRMTPLEAALETQALYPLKPGISEVIALLKKETI